METTVLLFLLFILLLALFLGFETLAKVPESLHAPSLSGSTLVSGVTILGAIMAASLATGGPNDFAAVLGGCAVALATASASGAFLLTDKILKETPPE